MRPLKDMLRASRDAVYRVLYRGKGRWCPVCDKTSRHFRPFGVEEKRPEAQCVHCGALERHRFIWLFFQRKTELFVPPGKSMLHVAPERALAPRLRARLGAGYITADLEDPRADVRMDITNIQYPDASFDVVYCSHVLEHVPDDRKAIREFHRVLKRDGWAIIMVPITVSRTVEDPNETDPKERLRRFGQDDHFRRYGPDFLDRLRAAGFTVQVVRVADVASEAELAQVALSPVIGDIYVCTKT